MRVLAAVAGFVKDLLVGDDPRLALGVVVVLVVAGILVVLGVTGPVVTVGAGIALLAAFSLALAVDVRRGPDR